MLSVCDYGEAVRNVYRIARAHDPATAMDSYEDVRDGYLAFLEARQPTVPINRLDDMFVFDEEIQSRLGAAFQKGALNDLNQDNVVGEAYTVDELARRTALAKEGLKNVLSLDSDFASLFALVIHSIFVRPSCPGNGSLGSHGGSSSASIGCIWLAMGSQIALQDLTEMYVHELTHHLMFIDELNNPQFNYKEIKKSDNFAVSAILRRRRPLDKVVHSIVVGASLIEARFRFLKSHVSTIIHPATPELIDAVRLSIASVHELPNLSELITDHTRGLLRESADLCRRYGTVH